MAAPAPGSPVRASIPECVRPYLEDGKTEVLYSFVSDFLIEIKIHRNDNQTCSYLINNV